MVVGLRQRVPVASPQGAARVVGLDDPPVGLRRGALEPGEERGADVERDAAVVVADFQDPLLGVEQPRGPVRRVALRGHARVPIVVGPGGVLDLDLLEPRVLPGGLVEMPVDADEAVRWGHGGSIVFRAAPVWWAPPRGRGWRRAPGR